MRTSFLCSPPLPGDTVRRPTCATAHLERLLMYLWTVMELRMKQGCTKKYNAQRGERFGERGRGVGNR